MTILYIMPLFYNTNPFIFFKVYKYKIFNNLAEEGINVLAEAKYIQDDSDLMPLFLGVFPYPARILQKIQNVSQELELELIIFLLMKQQKRE